MHGEPHNARLGKHISPLFSVLELLNEAVQDSLAQEIYYKYFRPGSFYTLYG